MSESSQSEAVVEGPPARQRPRGQRQKTGARRQSISTLLVADSSDVLSRGLCALVSDSRQLQLAGVVSSVGSAVEAAEAHDVDVVLCEEGLPGGGARRLTRMLVKRRANTAVVVLVDPNPHLLEQRLYGLRWAISRLCTGTALRNALQAVEARLSYVDPTLGELLDLASAREPVPRLTPREIDVLERLASGQGTREMASELSLGVETVKTHSQNILHKLGVGNRTAAVAEGFRQGIIE